MPVVDGETSLEALGAIMDECDAACEAKLKGGWKVEVRNDEGVRVSRLSPKHRGPGTSADAFKMELELPCSVQEGLALLIDYPIRRGPARRLHGCARLSLQPLGCSGTSAR